MAKISARDGCLVYLVDGKTNVCRLGKRLPEDAIPALVIALIWDPYMKVGVGYQCNVLFYPNANNVKLIRQWRKKAEEFILQEYKVELASLVPGA